MTGNRFLWRWSLRLLRREWRQHLVIAGLLGIGVAVGVGALVAVFNLAVPPDAIGGDGRVRASIVGDADPVRRALDEQGHRYGVIESASVGVDGSAVRLQLRAQAADDEVAAPLVDVLDGRRPTAADEGAVTDGLARRLGLGPDPIGEPLVIEPTGQTAAADDPGATAPALTIVGVVENPTDLDDDFALAADLDAIGIDPRLVATLFLVDAEPTDVVFPGVVGGISVETSGTGLAVDTRTALTLLVNLVTLLALLEAALLAGAGFAVVARRRTRQYGLLGAVGAGPRQLRQVATAGGLAVGVIGAALGVVVGLGVAAAVVPGLEENVGHRIDLSVPWWTWAPTAVLAIGAAGLAARWPTRGLANQPVARVLAARRPRSGPVGRLAMVGVGLAAVGTGLLLVGAAGLSVAIAVLGLALTPIGMLLATPAVVRAVGRLGRRLPLPARLAARSLDRQRGRSAAVVAALLVALGLPVGLVAVTSSIDRQRADELPNLTADLAIAWLPGAEDPLIEIPADLDPTTAAAEIDRLAAAAPDLVVVPIDVAIDPGGPGFSAGFERVGVAPAVMPAFAVRELTEACLTCDEFAFGDIDENGDELLFTGHEAWVATPHLVAALGLDPVLDVDTRPAAGDGELGVTRLDDVRLVDERLAPGPGGLQVVDGLPASERVAPVLLWPEAVADRGWETRTVGWLLVDPAGGEVAAALAGAGVSGTELLIETAVEPEPRTALRLLALAVGGVTALAVLAAAVALEVAEGAGDRRTLHAIGAAPVTSRLATAAGAALLALTGAVLAVPLGSVGLAALLAVPGIDLPVVVAWPTLLLVLVGVPTLAWLLGWFGAARSAGGGRVGLSSSTTALLPLAMATAVALVASACAVPGLEPGGRGADVEVDGDRATAPATTDGPDADSGGDASCDPGLDEALATWSEVGFAGSVAVLGGSRPCLAAYGPADAATGRGNTVDTVFSIGSVTKAVTAAAVLDLIDAGVLAFDDPVGRHRPDLDGPVADVTIRQLLLHTSGLFGQHGVDHVPLTEGEAIAAIGALELGFEPGRQYQYANANYTLLALVIEAVTDEGFRGYLRDRILLDAAGEPIGGFWDGTPAATGDRAVGYPDGENPGERGDAAGPHWALDGNGGVAMTAGDLARWTRALFTGEILSPRATGWLTSTTTHLADDVELPGWVRLDRTAFGETLIGASGGGGSIGHHVDVGWLPESERVIVIAVNRSTRRSDPMVGHVVPALIAGTGVPGPPMPPAVDPELVAAVSGRWAVAGESTLSAMADDGGLRVSADGAPALDLLFPLPDWLVAEAEEHEDLALVFARGESAEGRRQREAFEAEYGPIASISVDGTIFDGELVTLLRVWTEPGSADDPIEHRLALALNRFGGVAGAGIDGPLPAVWLAPDGAGGFGPVEPRVDWPSVTLRPESGTGADGATGRLVVDGPAGPVTLDRVEP